jgi:alpha-N-arabinofuranosidase
MAKQDSDKLSVRMSVMNRHPSLDWDATDLIVGGVQVDKVTIHEMYSDDLTAANSWDEPTKLKPVVTEYSAAEWAQRSHTVRKHSWQFIIVDGKAA